MSEPAAGAAWMSRRTDRVHLTYHQDDRPVADLVLNAFTTAYPRLTADIGFSPPDTIRIIIAGTNQEFQTLTQGAVPDWGAGCAIPDENLIVLKSSRIPGLDADVREVVVHELSHIVLNQALNGADVPRWLDEGFAMHESREWQVWQRLSLTLAVLSHSLIPLRDIRHVNTFSERKAQLAYLESSLAVRFILARYGRQGLQQLIQGFATAGTTDGAFMDGLGTGMDEFEAAWLEDLTRQYGWRALSGEVFSFWVIATLLFLLAYWSKRRQARLIVQRWEREEE
ncbi:MAG: hypothetical protein HY710_05080 [Candidatus Latescibacteria bacterium]|nr:hypothetical protein [Candidatus Latescibacterota bacterium]